MANQEHYDILKQGVEIWNRWRQEHPEIQPLLAWANLSKADLQGVDLHGAQLRKVNLSWADLRGANLSEAELYSANLHGAILNGADLQKAKLGGADLNGANLQKAKLNGAVMLEYEKEQLRGRGAIDLDEENMTVVERVSDEVKAEAVKSTATLRARSNVEVAESTSTLHIRITEEPLTAQNLTTIISALTDLHTKCWLIYQDRFADLIGYTQTRNPHFEEEAHLVIAKLIHKSPTLIDLLISSGSIASAVPLALSLKIAIDAIVQTPLRYKATKLENQKKELEMRLKTQEAQQAQQIAAQKAALEKEAEEQAQQIAAQKAELDRQEMLLEIAKQRLEIKEQLLEVQEKGLEFEKKRIEVALETASKMVDTLRPGIDRATKGMLIQPLLPSLLQLGNTEGLELADNEEQANKEDD